MTLPAFITKYESIADETGRYEIAWQAAHQAAQFLLNERPMNLTSSSKSTPTDLVTHMDRAAECMIVDSIVHNFPSDGIVGEEGAYRKASSEYRWIIDPLDGTVNYLFGIPLWGVSIGIEVCGEVEFGIVAIPAQSETFVAQRGHGAWRIVSGDEGQKPWERIAVRQSTSLNNALVTTGFGYSPDRRKSQAEVVRRMIPHIADIRRGGAAVVDLCWFACGRSDAYYEYGLNHWDYAAGALIAQEAGGIVRGLTSDDFSKFLLASTPQVFEDVRRLLINSGAQKIF